MGLDDGDHVQLGGDNGAGLDDGGYLQLGVDGGVGLGLGDKDGDLRVGLGLVAVLGLKTKWSGGFAWHL